MLTKVFSSAGESWGVILAIIAGLTMTLGNLVALQQSNPVRLLAYSSIAQAGFILAPLAVAGITGNFQDGIFASVTYLIIYAFMNLGAFLSVQLFSNHAGSTNFYEWGGIAKKSPITGVLTTIFFFSLAGIPPLGGWFAKFVVFRSMLSTGEPIGLTLGIVGAVNAVIALVYYARISKVIWMDELKDVDSENSFQFESPLKVVGVFTVLITFISGIFPGIFSYLGEVSSIFFGN